MTPRIPRNKKEPDVKVKHLPPNADKAIENHSDRISFSFHYLNLKHDKFDINSKTGHYFKKLMDRLKDISGMETRQLTSNSSKTLRCHPIKWEATT